MRKGGVDSRQLTGEWETAVGGTNYVLWQSVRGEIRDVNEG
jgi:hypothetical protein